MASTSLANDTSPDIERQQIARWRERTAAEKAAIISGLSGATQEIALAGIRTRHPNAGPREHFLRLAIINLGFALARRAYPEIDWLVERDSQD